MGSVVGPPAEVVLDQYPSMVVGRWDRCHICLEDPLLSEVHAIISLREGVLSIKDLNSMNGVWLNSVKLALDRVELQDGDLLAFGNWAVGSQLCYRFMSAYFPVSFH
ncbi:SMAD/FHA domain-containing protein [Pavlovales sp. CCMP2436]|nr:SMAD/FHA domain-containing protein [Pavlovales sp. CCMP2436]